MNRNIIIDLFLYFARFPQRQGVLDIFNKGRSEIPGYDSLKSLVESMTDTPVLPEVRGFVFGPNFDAVKTCVSQLTGYYLFVDYGDIKTETDKSNRIADTFQVAATIAGKTTEFTGRPRRSDLDLGEYARHGDPDAELDDTGATGALFIQEDFGQAFHNAVYQP